MASASQQPATTLTRPGSGAGQTPSTTSASATSGPPPATPPKFNTDPFKTSKTPSFQFQAPALTGAGAMADAKRADEQAKSPHHGQTSPNPAANAMKGLQGQPMSSPSDAPTGGTQGASLVTPSTTVTAEPMQIDENSSRDTRPNPDDVTDPRLTAPEANSSSTLAVPQERSNKAFSYPPRVDQIEGAETPNRSMTLPGSTSRSSGGKKHRCNHCGTEFTRHHNLKSHLLTHSQEKPFECNRCDQKFRRLHDLKRHTKLHTGERPHTCSKCGRAFARGDALARHNKGPGGCAGRRGSGGEDDLDGEDGMDGVEYDENGDPSAKRRKSEQPLHSRKRSLNAMVDSQAKQHSMTYPNPGIAIMGNQQPPSASHMSTTHLSPRMNSTASQFSPQQQPSPGVFAQGGMTESPRPLSPGAERDRRLSAGLPPLARARSPSLAQQLHRNSIVGSPAASAMPGTASQPTLPSLGSLNSDRPPSSLSSSIGGNSRVPPVIATGQAINKAGPGSANSSNPPSATSQNRSSGGSLREIVNPVSNEDYMLKADHEAQIRKMQDDMTAMRERMQRMESHIHVLNTENNQLRTTVGRQSYPPPAGVQQAPPQPASVAPSHP